MKISKVSNDNYIVIKAIGELDASSSIHMDNEIKNAFDAGKYNVLIDCEGLNYISSAGVGVFVSYFEDFAQKGGKFVFFNMKDSVRNIFNILGLNEIFTIVDSEAEATKELNES